MAAHEYIDTRVLAERYGISPVTAERWRCRGNGPPFYRFGRRIIYRVSDIEAWLEARRGHGGTP